jgi:hypothetical protein
MDSQVQQIDRFRSLKIAAVLISSVASVALLPVASMAETTSSTSPDAVLDPMKAGAGDMDELAGLAAAIGISSTVYGVGANIFKRFGYG